MSLVDLCSAVLVCVYFEGQNLEKCSKEVD